MDRRTLVGAVGVGLAGHLSGCVDALDGSEPETPTPPDTDPHDLFVVNYTATTVPATIRVVDADGTAVVDGRYELPDERGIEFDDVGGWETTYAIDIAVDGRDQLTFEWATPDCGSVSEATRYGGSRNGYVRVRAAEGGGYDVSLVVDACDEIRGPEFPTGPAEYFRLADGTDRAG